MAGDHRPQSSSGYEPRKENLVHPATVRSMCLVGKSSCRHADPPLEVEIIQIVQALSYHQVMQIPLSVKIIQVVHSSRTSVIMQVPFSVKINSEIVQLSPVRPKLHAGGWGGEGVRGGVPAFFRPVDL